MQSLLSPFVRVFSLVVLFVGLMFSGLPSAAEAFDRDGRGSSFSRGRGRGGSSFSFGRGRSRGRDFGFSRGFSRGRDFNFSLGRSRDFGRDRVFILDDYDEPDQVILLPNGQILFVD